MGGERQTSGQGLVCDAVRILDLPEDRDYEVNALRLQASGPKVRAEITTEVGRSFSVEVSECEIVAEDSGKIHRLIGEVVDDADREVSAI